MTQDMARVLIATAEKQRQAPIQPNRVLVEQVRLLYASVRSAATVEMCITTIFWVVIYWQLQDTAVMAWAALHFAKMLRAPLRLRYAKDPKAEERSVYWHRFYCQEVFITGVVWGLAPWFFLHKLDVALATMMIVFILSKFTMGVIAMVASRQVVSCYVWPMVAGLASFLVWQVIESSGTNQAIYAFGVFGLLSFGISMVVFSRHLNSLLTRSLQTQFEKEALADELQLKAAEVQRISDEKTRFLAAASHDLRQPLHAIALFGAVLDKELAGKTEHRHTVSLMHAVKALGTSLDSMLDVSQLDAGIIKPDLRPMALAPMLENLNHMFANRANDKGLELRMRVSTLWTYSDPHLLQRVLGNLIENALKFTTRGGVVVMARARGNHIWLDVRDTGVGIAPEYTRQIFDEYYQIGHEGRDRAQGMGIGLAVVRRITALLLHPVLVQSRLGRGSRFRVVLPKAVALPEPGVPDGLYVSRNPSQQNEVSLKHIQRVLLLDDEADIGDAVSAYLALHRVQVVLAADEAQAQRAFEQAASQQQPFNAIISDYRLQGGADGVIIALALRKRFAPRLPILVITGETSPEKLHRVTTSGLKVLFKPVTGPALVRALSELVELVELVEWSDVKG